MFTLHYKIDDVVAIEGQTFQVNMAFDNVLRFLEMLEDKDLSEAQKIEVGLGMLLGESLHYDLTMQSHILNELTSRFFQVEEEKPAIDLNGNVIPVKREVKKVYSFKHDSEFIYASFMQAYGIDLLGYHGKLHWQKFKALLNGLPEDTKFMQVVSIRQRKLPSGKDSSEERRQLMMLKEIYALPDE